MLFATSQSVFTDPHFSGEKNVAAQAGTSVLPNLGILILFSRVTETRRKKHWFFKSPQVSMEASAQESSFILNGMDFHLNPWI